MEVLHVDILVWCRFALTPQQETFFGCHLFNGNILNGKTKNNRPDHTQRHFQVAIDNFFGTDRHQFDAFGLDEIERFVHVGDL